MSNPKSPDVGGPDFWIGEAPEDLEYSAVGSSEAPDYDLEDFVYDNLHEATGDGSPEYPRQEVLDVFDISWSVDPSEVTDRSDEINGLMLVDDAGKAIYAVLQDYEDTVELDIKIFGDRSGVENYVENLPTGGYTEGVETVDGMAFSEAAAKVPEHPMNVETDTQLPEPVESPEESFTNGQAKRIKRKVSEE